MKLDDEEAGGRGGGTVWNSKASKGMEGKELK